MRFIVALLVLSALSIAAGAGFTLLFGKGPAAQAPAEAASAGDASHGAGQTLKVYDLPSVITNLGAPTDVWIRLEASIVFDPSELKAPEAIGAVIADDMLAYLRTLTMEQLQGPVGLQTLRQELADRAFVRSGKLVREFVLKTLVMQ